MAFITQQTDVAFKSYDMNDNGELEALISGISQSSQSTLLLKKRKELREVDDALEFMKEEYAARMRACEDRHRDFLTKQKEMKEQVTRFEKFIQENDAKKTRAENKTKQELKLTEQCSQKIIILREQLARLESESKELSKRVTKLRKFPKFLELTVEASEGEYDEINDMLNRHKTLVDAKSDLQKLVAKGEQENDKMRTDLNHLERETQNQFLVHNSEIHRFQKQLEELRAETYKMEIEAELQERYDKDRQRDMGQIIMSIRNLYSRCVMSKHVKMPMLDDRKMKQNSYLEECLNVVMFQLTDLDSICKAFKGHGDQEVSRNGFWSSMQNQARNHPNIIEQHNNNQDREMKLSEKKKDKKKKDKKSKKKSKHSKRSSAVFERKRKDHYK